jgi:hypothetical protein
MPTDLNEHPAKPEQRDENFGEGPGDPARFPEDEAVGRFDEVRRNFPKTTRRSTRRDGSTKARPTRHTAIHPERALVR